MSLETWQAKYPTFAGEQLQNLTLRETMRVREETDSGAYVWSARLSTGLFGKHDCPSGNASYAPKGASEVMISVGKIGLAEVIDLGFIPCPTCHPENSPNFWEDAENAIEFNYPQLENIQQFADKNVVPFDSRRVNWEALAPYLTTLPNRLYLPKGLTEDNLRLLEIRFKLLNFKLPPMGYYDHDAPGHFFEYKLS